MTHLRENVRLTGEQQRRYVADRCVIARCPYERGNGIYCPYDLQEKDMRRRNLDNEAFIYYKSVENCEICNVYLGRKTGHIDHWHGCPYCRGRNNQPTAKICNFCIRGTVCVGCNTRLLPIIDKYFGLGDDHHGVYRLARAMIDGNFTWAVLN